MGKNEPCTGNDVRCNWSVCVPDQVEIYLTIIRWSVGTARGCCDNGLYATDHGCVIQTRMMGHGTGAACVICVSTTGLSAMYRPLPCYIFLTSRLSSLQRSSKESCLVMKPAAPACMHLSLSTWLEEVVYIKTGTD